MSEHIVHTAVLEDCLHLVTNSEEINEEFREICKAFGDFAQLGSVTVSGDMFSTQLLKEFKPRWQGRAPEEMLEAKLLFVFGWISHRAADRQMKPVWNLGHIRELEKSIGLRPTDCSVYHEAFILKQYYFSDPVFKGSVLIDEAVESSGLPSIDLDVAMRFIHTLVKRSLIEMHTFKPDYDNVEVWLEKLFTRQQKFYVDVERYARAVVFPDPEKYKTYITDIHFYDENDPILAVLKKLRNSELVSSQEISSALVAYNGSHYAQAVVRGYNYIKASIEYLTTEMDFAEVEEKLDIGKTGPEGLIV